MKTITFTIVFFALCSCTLLAQKGDITKFYPHVDSVCEFPAIDQKLVILGRKKLMQRYISLVGYASDSVARIAAVTLKPLTNPNTDISRLVEFNGIQPSPGKVNTWGYIFDRNNDGKIDYMALVGGAGAFKGLDFPDDFPRRGDGMTRDQIEYFVGHCKTVFNHWADDNYDGALDGVIHISMDPDREWVDHRLLVRSKEFNRKFDDVRGFWTNLDEQQVAIEHTPTSVSIYPIGKPKDEEITPKTLEEKSRIMQLIDQTIKACKIPPTHLLH